MHTIRFVDATTFEERMELARDLTLGMMERLDLTAASDDLGRKAGEMFLACLTSLSRAEAAFSISDAEMGEDDELEEA